MRVRRSLVAAILAVSTLVGTVGTPSAPASACSLVGPRLEVPASVAAGGTLSITGRGFFDVVGDLGADCGGDHEFVAKTGVVVTVRFETLGDPVIVSLPAPVDDADGEFTIGPLDVPVPADARSAAVSTSEGFGEPLVVDVVGLVVTDTEAPAAPPAAPPPARPVAATPTFAG